MGKRHQRPRRKTGHGIGSLDSKKEKELKISQELSSVQKKELKKTINIITEELDDWDDRENARSGEVAYEEPFMILEGVQMFTEKLEEELPASNPNKLKLQKISKQFKEDVFQKNDIDYDYFDEEMRDDIDEIIESIKTEYKI